MPSARSTTCILHHQLDKAGHYRAEKRQEATSASFATQPVFEHACSEMDQLLCPEPKQFNFYLITIINRLHLTATLTTHSRRFIFFLIKKVVTFVDDVDLHKWFWKLRWATCSANRYLNEHFKNVTSS
jgi:hypothetical protein